MFTIHFLPNNTATTWGRCVARLSRLKSDYEALQVRQQTKTTQMRALYTNEGNEYNIYGVQTLFKQKKNKISHQNSFIPLLTRAQ